MKHSLRLLVVGVCLSSIAGMSTPANGASSDRGLPTAVWGQPDFVSGRCQHASASTLCGPAQATRDSQGNLWIADLADNRILMYPLGSSTASKVFGQYGVLNSTGCDQRPPRAGRYPAAPNRYTLCQPIGVAIDSRGTLYVADSINNRVLIYFHAAQKPPDTPADRVLGQTNFHATASNDVRNAGGPNCPNTHPASRCTLNGPMELSLDVYGDLLVPDFDNHRVLLWSAASLAHLESRACAGRCVIAASRVWGQYGSFATNVANNPRVPSRLADTCTKITVATPDSACTLSGPWAAVGDSQGNLFISDTDNNRLLEYDRALSNGRQDASAVYGQAGHMATNFGNMDGISASSLWHPIGLALDATGNLWTTDFYNRRVLAFPRPGVADADHAVVVLGQEGRFDTKTCGVSRKTLCGPTSISFDESGDAYVVDGLNSRMLEYPPTNTG